MKSTLVSKENNEAKLTLEFTAEEFDAAVFPGSHPQDAPSAFPFRGDGSIEYGPFDFLTSGKVKLREALLRDIMAKGSSSRMPSTICSMRTIRKRSRKWTWKSSIVRM